ncbi:RIP metalloprotease RseP [Granulicatella seriolae]|uniref:Zinc metalloprotease n=1 Tax=Granulicatella seriolae TaxID=2967226 RepID=A0ABT1WMU0_9LACT|nr:RIP metalloprotease RseP [Granulicatella seriolae]
MIQTIIAFLFVFSVIVIIHEAGHYYFAKRAGILVREFAIGMGPKLLQFRRGETVFTIRILPIGGYVRMAGLGEEGQDIRPGMSLIVEMDSNQVITRISLDEKYPLADGIPLQVQEADLEKEMFIEGYLAQNTELERFTVSKKATIIEEGGTEIFVAPIERQFQSAPLLKRMMTNFAGPMNNFILAIITFTIVAFLRGGVTSNSNVIGQVVAGMPAANAGLLAGDAIVSVDGTPTNDWVQLTDQLIAKPDQSIQLEILRDGQKQSVTLTSQSDDNNGTKVGKIGIMVSQDTSFMSKISYGFTATWAVMTSVLSVLSSFFTKGFSINQLGGPVAMYSLTSQVVQNGFVQVLNLLAVLSVNLGIMNLLPIPALDGGKLVLNAIEGVRGKPLDPQKESYITIAGAIILLVIMLLVTWNDILRLF